MILIGFVRILIETVKMLVGFVKILIGCVRMLTGFVRRFIEVENFKDDNWIC